jgi:hypothetical protein
MKNGKCMRSGAQPRSFSAQPRQRSPTRNAEGFRSVKVPWPYPPLPDVDLISKEDVIMRKLVMKTLSSVRQWLLPACATHRSALLWYKKAQHSGRDNCGHMVRISTQALGPDRIIDVSTQSAQKAFFRGNYDQWGLAGVDDVGRYLKRAIGNCEVELMWRGRININLMEVVDPDTGDYLMQYRDALAQRSIAMVTEIKQLDADHHASLMGIAKEANLTKLPEWIPLSPFSTKVLREHSDTYLGSQLKQLSWLTARTLQASLLFHMAGR